MKTLYQFLLEKQKNHLLPVFGFAETKLWELEKKYPIHPDFFPENIFPLAKTAIVIGVPVNLPILETTPSVYYNEHYKTLNAFLDHQALEISLFLNEENMPSMPVSRDGYAGISALLKNPVAAFSHKHAAYHAGLGTFGRNNVILTKKYGPRIRFTTVLTAAALDELGVDQSGVGQIPAQPEMELCIECLLCARLCPKGAICGDKEIPYPQSKIDKQKCTAQSEYLANRGISPCGVCIKVCPIGEDRKAFGRTNIRIYDDENENITKTGMDESKWIRSWNHIRKYGKK
ncbi:epoxyqueuosine reductase [Methanolapillus ohkumae]|uniref:4Fe-4S ferredoxin-type domain-containing protein n=1 Tax=Methanolapillus ohkumae TaxID=3028298 RepID=A0AA96VEY6_9EURY|nr:hypothetical protein MsAm2_09120 [Methanosarcinaceae archaeon Am2]